MHSTSQSSKTLTFQGFLTILLIGVFFLSDGTPNMLPERRGPPPEDKNSVGLGINLANLPLAFIPNAGQFDQQVKFQAKSPAGTLFFTQDEVALVVTSAILSQPGQKQNSLTTDLGKEPGKYLVRLRFENTNVNLQITGSSVLPGVINYLIGDDPTNWRTGITRYRQLVYQELYPGINLLFEGEAGALKGTYTIAPGVDAGSIRWKYLGTNRTILDEKSGDLIINLLEPVTLKPDQKMDGINRRSIIEHAPYAWQEINGNKISVEVHYIFHDDASLGFEVGNYDPHYPLVIDPTLDYSTYLGGSRSDDVRDIAVNKDGNAYVTGQTDSPDFPSDGKLTGLSDIFVTKFSSKGNQLVYSTLIGGSENEAGMEIALDEDGTAYIIGQTNSENFPTVNPVQNNLNGLTNVILAKLESSSGSLIFSTYLGGSSVDEGLGIALDGSGNAYLTGATDSPDFPLLNAFDSQFDFYEAYVTKIDTIQSELVYSTYLGGDRYDGGDGIFVDDQGYAFVTGTTDSLDFPLVNPFQPATGGGNCEGDPCKDAFISIFSPDGAALEYSSYFGGSSDDYAYSISLDKDENIYISGSTISPDLPINMALQENLSTPTVYDIFISKFNPSGTELLFSTYIGGPDDDYADMTVGQNGDVYLGGTNPSCIPVLSHERANQRDSFIARISTTGGGVSFYKNLGGSKFEHGLGIDLDEHGNIYITGMTDSNDFPTRRAFDNTFAGELDTFVAKFLVEQAPPFSGKLVYLPLLMNPFPPRGIYGRVSDYFCGAANVSLELRYYDGEQWSTRATTITKKDGSFSFTGIPSLAPGERYYVLYRNPEDDNTRVSSWGTPMLTVYTEGTDVHISDFDLANIGLIEPSNGEILTRPFIFMWGMRFKDFGDSYELNMFDPFNEDIWWWTPPLGFVYRYELTGLPGGFHARTPYLWFVGAYSPDGGYGTSYWANWFEFGSGTSSREELPANEYHTIPLNSLWPTGLPYEQIRNAQR